MTGDRSFVSPGGMRLLWQRALSRAVEVRLLVAWPPTSPGMAADRFPEPRGGGYERQSLPPSAWSFSDVGAVAAAREFLFSGPPDNAQSVIGYVLVDKDTEQILHAQEFQDVPLNPEGRSLVTVTPSIRWQEPR